MGERVAVVGSRQGADLEHLASFLNALWKQQPDTILVSGGAEGVDKFSERFWLSLGGRVVSFRPYKMGLEDYAIERWELGGDHPRTYVLIDYPTFLNYKSACIGRDLLIVEEADRVVAFYKPGRSRGTSFTCEIAENEANQRPVYEYEAGGHDGEEEQT